MIFAEPPQTTFDVRFKLGRVPVRIHPFFWVSTLGLSLQPGATILGVSVWVVTVLISILVHELGHAGAFYSFGWKPRITLYGFGGLASADARGAARPPSGRTQILISAAGPFAGFALAGIVTAMVLSLGYQVPLLHWTIGSGAPIASRALYLFVFDVMVINVLWGLINLLPVHPLDGGQIALEVAQARDPINGVKRSVWISFIVATATALVGLVAFGSVFTAFLFGYLAFTSWLVLRRRYNAGFGSLSAGQSTRRPSRASPPVRPQRLKTKLRIVGGNDRVDSVEPEGPNAEIDRVVDDLFERVSKDFVKMPPGEPRGKPKAK